MSLSLPRLRLPRWRLPRRPRLRLLLPVTSGVIVLLLLPALLLQRFPRSNAAGLERLVPVASLIQSFAAAPSRPVPSLWQERLSVPLATRLWARQQGQWWQLWGESGDGGTLLAISDRAFEGRPERALPANSFRVDDLLVIAADPLSRQQLQQQLSRSTRPPKGMEKRCVEQLRSAQAVAWTGTALNQLSGPLAPLLGRFQQGCLVLGGDATGLTWQGEATGSGKAAAAALPRLPAVPPRQPLPAALLLDVEGDRLDLLFEGLLSRQLIRQPLVDRYGLQETLLLRLGGSPFRLRLSPQPAGVFQASLELQLQVGKQRQEWIQWLAQLREALKEQGLVEQLPAAAAGAEAPPSTIAAQLPTGVWLRQDGTVVGGWRWIRPPTGDPPLLAFFLGSLPPALPAAPLPAAPPPEATLPEQESAATKQVPQALRLRARPQALAALGLLPPALPPVLQQSDQLELLARWPAASEGGANAHALLAGSLQLGAAPAPGAKESPANP
ncbi:hypothetical protein KBY97_01360 [Synechococcus sp. ATX 2A4]|uniref:hypothetical protein n=1 Tax=Synechococcus sp. ATX 2A4 TaxID=2823727 RepID=UPI0020CD4FC9|nr:hypothetical protein [Synechococcus sp. ATX 2A4]MCP9883776.1 hypothetical protein [Synechococcus sp. ATX 2A4]